MKDSGEMHDREGFCARLLRLADTQPDKLAVAWIDEKGVECGRLSYRELFDAAARVASGLLGSQVAASPGDRVLLVFPPGLDFLAAFVGCLLAGVVSVPVYPPNPKKLSTDLKRLCAIKSASSCSVALTSATFKAASSLLMLRAKWEGLMNLGRCVCISCPGEWPEDLSWYCTDFLGSDASLFNGFGLLNQAWSWGLSKLSGQDSSETQDTQLPFSTVDWHARAACFDASDNVAYLQFTSGSTGTPKGVMITYKNLAANIHQMNLFMGPKQKDLVNVSWLPQYHDAGLVCSTLLVLYDGGSVHMMSPVTFLRDPLLWLLYIDKMRANATVAPNFGYELIIKRWLALKADERPPLDLSCVKIAASVAEPVWQSTARTLFKVFGPVGFSPDAFMPGYGLAEAVVAATWERGGLICDPDNGRVACGPVGLPGAPQIRIVNPQTCEEVPERSTGEIWVSGPNVAIGYWNRKELSEETFYASVKSLQGKDARYLRTGDEGYVRDGHLYICGRIKDMLIVGGRNIYATDVEKTIQEACPELRPGCIAVFTKALPNSVEQVENKVSVVAEVKDSWDTEGGHSQLMGRIAGVVQQGHEVLVETIALIEPRTIPKTTSGKVQRFKCRQRLLDGELTIVTGGLSSDGSCSDMEAEPPADVSDDTVTHGSVGEKGCGSSDAMPESFDCGAWLMRLFKKHGVRDFSVGLTANGMPSVSLQAVLQDISDVCMVRLDIADLMNHSVETIIQIIRKQAATRLRFNVAVWSVRLQQSASYPNHRPAVALWKRAGHLAFREVGQTCANVCADMRGAPSPQSSRPVVDKHHLSMEPRGKALPYVAQVLIEAVGIVLVLLLMGVALLPGHHFEAAAPGTSMTSPAAKWTFRHLVDGILAPAALFPALLMSWQLSFSCIVIITKWVVIGQYKSQCLAMWSPDFFRWWLVDRLVSVWEMFVGSFISGTWLANLFYYSMGTDCPIFLASIQSPIREFDLVKIGSNGQVKGRIFCRSFAPNRLWFAPVVCGKRSVVDSMAVIMPGATVAEDCTIAPLAVLLEGSRTKPNAIFSGNPAIMVEKKGQAPQLMDATTMAYEALVSFIKGVILLALLYITAAAVGLVYVLSGELNLGFEGLWDVPAFPFVTAYFGGATLVAALSIGLKWALLGRVKGGLVRNTLGRRLRTWAVDAAARGPMWILTPWIRRSPLFNMYYRLLGMRLPVFASSVGPGFVPPSGADLVALGEKSFAASGVCKVERDVGNGNVELCECLVRPGSTLGLWAVCGPGLVCGYNSVVGIATHAREGVPDNAMMIGNPPVLLNSTVPDGDRPRDRKLKVADAKFLSARDDLDVLRTMGVRAEGDTIKASGVVGAWSVRPPVQTLGGVGFWALGLRNMLGRLVMSLLFLACVVLPSYQALVRLHCPEGQGCHPSPLTLVVTPPLMGATILAGFVGTLIFLSRLFRAALKLSAAEVRLPLSSLCFLMYSELLVFSVLGRDYFLNPFLSGTCFMRWLYRALGARLGRRVHLSDPPLMDCHMLTIGDDAILDNTECQGHVLVGGVLSTSPTSVGRGCVLQPGSAVFGGDRVEDGAWVGPRTKAMPGQVFSSGEHWHGVPACAVRVRTAPVQ